MEDMKQIIARNIAELRRGVGMTQLELAEKLNYSDKAVSKWERGESIPDITVLKAIADLFGVTVDYLITSEHPVPEPPPAPADADTATPWVPTRSWIHKRGVITGMAILLVWLVATTLFVILSLTLGAGRQIWLAFVYAVPVSLIVWLVMNSVWFNRRRNFLIVSLLMWTALAAVYLSALAGGVNIWLIFVLGVPGQAIVLLWSGMGRKMRGVEAKQPTPANDNDTPSSTEPENI